MADPVAFNEDRIMGRLTTWIDELVGDQLGVMGSYEEEGNTIPIRSIIVTEYGTVPATQPPLPFVALTFMDGNNTQGYQFDSGTVDIEVDGETQSYPYYDQYIRFGVSVRVEGDGAGSILRDIRRKIVNNDHTRVLYDELGIIITPTASIINTPDLLATQYREVKTMLLTMETVDRYIDYDGFVFESVDSTGFIKKAVEDISEGRPIDNETSAIP